MTELPPLYETIDPDALDTLLDSLDEDNTAFSLEFTYAGQHISINTGGTVSCDQE
ncbi:HalOD1 output domain-containing protein [Haloarcula sp. JP-L23]|uniref:HalOD1 output domain-containing protein n=1 Tax=Haloarcula sp. JP-L23 TaxID=2716717 RepID=UPI003742A071